MCPPVSTLARIDINVSSSDEEVMGFLDERKAGDPLPSNFITEVNPFSLEPWDAPEGKWYLYNSEDGWSYNQLSIFKATQSGYWRSMDHLTIFRNNETSGRKIIWEFHVGEEPVGNRTGWLMYDYHKFQKACEGINCAQDWGSLCRVFLQDDQREIFIDQKSPDRELFNPICSDNVDIDHIESILLSFLDHEERSPTDPLNQPEAGSHKPEHKSSCQDIPNSDSSQDSHSFTEFSEGGYLELKDLYDLESTSSSSDGDSTLNSRSSDACFDADALLRDLDNESHGIVRQSPAVGSSIIEECVPSGSSPSRGYSLKTSGPMPSSDGRLSASTSGSGSCLHGHPKRTHSGCSDCSINSSNGSGSKSVARISKLGKKYCCFVPF